MYIYILLFTHIYIHEYFFDKNIAMTNFIKILFIIITFFSVYNFALCYDLIMRPFLFIYQQ